MNRKELIEKRSINTKVFENQDHSCTAEIYLAPVHYKDTDGTWKEMDNKRESSAIQLPMKAQTVHICTHNK